MPPTGPGAAPHGARVWRSLLACFGGIRERWVENRGEWSATHSRSVRASAFRCLVALFPSGEASTAWSSASTGFSLLACLVGIRERWAENPDEWSSTHSRSVRASAFRCLVALFPSGEASTAWSSASTGFSLLACLVGIRERWAENPDEWSSTHSRSVRPAWLLGSVVWAASGEKRCATWSASMG